MHTRGRSRILSQRQVHGLAVDNLTRDGVNLESGHMGSGRWMEL